jgi:branched-chain amino acid transport system ATP-binding protein
MESSALTMHFGGIAALTDINFRLVEGELRCLIGPNGAGKSTFFKCLTGQYQSYSGVIRVRGEPIRGLPSYQIARLGVGIKMQVPSVFENLTASENVWVASARLFRKHRAVEAALRCMEHLGIAHLSKIELCRLSHGQRQLVELAMVLVADPALILLDEPAAGMTDIETNQLVLLIKELSRTRTLIVVDHDMPFIKRIATHVTVFSEGRILVEGGVEEVMSNPIVRDVYLGKASA